MGGATSKNEEVKPAKRRDLKSKLARAMDRSARTKPKEADEWFHVPTNWLRKVQRKLAGVRTKNPGPMPLWKLLDSSGQPKRGLKQTSIHYDADKLRREYVAKNTVGWNRMSDEKKIWMIDTRRIYQVSVHATVCIGPDGDYVSVTRELWECLINKYGIRIDTSFLSTTKPNIYYGLFGKACS